MDINLRKDNLFVQDKKWHEMNKNYSRFLDKINDSKVVFLEMGVGYNTPSIIRFPLNK